MAKQVKGQQDLIDVTPENVKELIDAAVLYKKYQKERMAASDREVEQKTLIRELMRKADLQQLAGGKIKFEHDGFKITVTPRDELVEVTNKAEKAEAEPEPE